MRAVSSASAGISGGVGRCNVTPSRCLDAEEGCEPSLCRDECAAFRREPRFRADPLALEASPVVSRDLAAGLQARRRLRRSADLARPFRQRAHELLLTRGAAELRSDDAREIELLAGDLLLRRFDAQLGGAPSHRSPAGEVERLRERQELLGLAGALARVVERRVRPAPLALDVTAREIELRRAERDDALRACAMRTASSSVSTFGIVCALAAVAVASMKIDEEALKTQSPLLSQKRGS